MCEYCEKQKEIQSCNFGGIAKARIVGAEINVWGDGSKIKWLRTVYNPSFKISYCLMCGRKLTETED